MRRFLIKIWLLAIIGGIFISTSSGELVRAFGDENVFCMMITLPALCLVFMCNYARIEDDTMYYSKDYIEYNKRRAKEKVMTYTSWFICVFSIIGAVCWYSKEFRFHTLVAILQLASSFFIGYILTTIEEYSVKK